jgi:rubrerythrin
MNSLESGYMEKFESVEQVLDFAIFREGKAYEIYTYLASKVRNPKAQKILEDLALEEFEHKTKLEAVKADEVKLDMEEAKHKLRFELEYDLITFWQQIRIIKTNQSLKRHI